MHCLNKRVAAVLISSFVVALVLLAPTITRADEWNLATRFTINQPFEVPGAVLEANTPYVIRLYDSPAERRVVHIFNEDQSKLLTTFMAIRDERLEPTDETKFTFMEVAPGYPVPIKEWFYPGRLSGLEFLYPKDQMDKITAHLRGAVTTTEVAVATPEPVIEEVGELEPVVVEEEEIQIAQLEPAEEIQREKASEEPEFTEAEEPAPVPESEEPAELPATAGELPLIGLIGMLCLGAGLGLKVLSSRS